MHNTLVKNNNKMDYDFKIFTSNLTIRNYLLLLGCMLLSRAKLGCSGQGLQHLKIFQIHFFFDY